MQQTTTAQTLSRATFVACLVFWAISVSTVFGQFRDVTPVKEPKLTPTAKTESAPEPIPQPIPDLPIADGEANEVAQLGSEEPRKKLTIEELEELLEGEIETLPDEDFGLRSLRFRGIVVGESTLQELLDLWGSPFRIVKSPSSRIIKYRAHPFRQVDVTVIDDTVVSLLIHLNDLLDPAHCAKELHISNLTPVPVPDEEGEIMGMAFPERGVLFSYDPRDPDMLVSKIQLEPVNPEPFVMRAEYDYDNQFDRDLADLDQAIEMSPRYGRAYAVRAQILRKIGRYQDALEAAEKATHFDSENDRYRMLKATLMADNGNHEAAQREAERVLDGSTVPVELKAWCEKLIGDMLAEGAEGKYKEAMTHHLRSIELAAPVANDAEFAKRRLAKELLTSAHLAVARDISLGDFQDQDTIVPKWLGRARALSDEFVENDQGDPIWKLRVYRQALATAGDIHSVENPSKLIDEMLEEGERQTASTTDPRAKSRLDWVMGATLAEAVRLERIRGNEDVALDLADQALAMLQRAAKSRQSTPAQRYLVGRLYFHIGSMYAVQRSDHEEAIAWYRKAEPLLSGGIPLGVLANVGTHGEMFVSMGVSYWQEGNMKRAISLTEQGTDILQRAVVQGILQPESLSIPYGNLATMHKKSGNRADAEAFAELAGSLTGQSTLR